MPITTDADGNSRLSFWPRVREFAVPPSMIKTATARRETGDWAGACAAAHVDVDLDLRTAARAYGRELAARVRADLRRLAPDLLRWHLPRIAPDGLLRPELTIALARYDVPDHDGRPPVHLVVRTPPAWADAGQRIALALWDGTASGAGRHPRPRPHRRYRLDLHRHLWDAERAGELRVRSGADLPPPDDGPAPAWGPPGPVPPGPRYAVRRWADEAAILLRAEGRSAGTVAVRTGGGHRLFLDVLPHPVADPAADAETGRAGDTVPGPLAGRRCPYTPEGLLPGAYDAGPPVLRPAAALPPGGAGTVPVLPDAATWEPPDLDLLRRGVITADRLHPLVASALVPGHPASGPPPDPAGGARVVECRGARHRIGLVDGVLVALDHDPEEVRREELLAALTGTPLPCLRAIDDAHRRPECLDGVRDRLMHGDTAGALAVVEELLGPGARLRAGALRDELEAAARRRITYGLYRAGLTRAAPPGRPRRRTATVRSHPRHAVAR